MIVDTNGLSALADGESSLAPILRRVTEVAIPVIVLGQAAKAAALSHTFSA